MNRIQMIDFINKEVLPGAEITDWEWIRYGSEIVEDIIDAISKWRIGKPINVKMECKIRDGVLYINGNSVRRVACRLPRVPFNEAEYYWEGRCIR